ncbi:MAG: SUMF1/EgtB/PvdO family nonheme iron enzyme, partial [Nitrospinae bacterium]|nr:SUMF1/EgtB/PvdO family nonheme iron enzyme [Nitrospinota bacterium]
MKYKLMLLSVCALAINAAGCGSSSGGGERGADPLAIVTGLTVTPGDGANRLAWNGVEGAASYNVYWEEITAGRSAGRAADCSGERMAGITGTGYTHTGLINGLTYGYNVTAVDGDGNEGECGGSTASATPKQSGGDDPRPTPTAGVCGTAHGKVYAVGDSSYGSDTSCAVGTASPAPPAFPAQGGSANWSCLGRHGGAAVACSASRDAPTPVNGLCGTADGQVYLYTDTTYGADTFCDAGTVDPSSPAFPAIGGGSAWDCLGVNGGSDDACSATRGADTDPPVTTVALAEVSKSSTTWSGSATIDEAGTGYCTAVTNGSPAPTAAEVKADNDGNVAGTGGSIAMTANTTATCQVTGLTAATDYDFYFVAEDGSTNLQADGDVSGPVSSTTGSATATTLLALGVAIDTVVDLVAETDTNSTGYCVAVPEGSAAPTVAQIAAAAGGAIVGTGGSVALTANSSDFCQVTGLTASTAYDFYFVAKDAANVYQGSAGSVLNESTTAAQGGAPAGMVAVLGGCFQMGDNLDNNTLGGGDESPVHPVCLTSYYIDANEVRQDAYDAWGGDAGHPGHAIPAIDNPANNVDWIDASAYCAAAGKRLPTEAEWEYAARERGAVVRYGTGGNAIACADANYNNCVGMVVVAVGSYAANALGIYDMSGNVWEFVSDYYDAAYYSSSPVTDPKNT